MSSSLAWAAPIANTATAPKQVVSRKLRIGILPATMPRVTDAKAHTVPRVGTRSVGKASGSVSQRRRRVAFTPRLAYEYVRIPVTPDVLEAGSRNKIYSWHRLIATKNVGAFISLAQATHAVK